LKTCDLAIVGAGPGGLAAATEAVAFGLSVTVIDDNPGPGGQYFRQPPGPFRRHGRSAFDKERVRAEALFRVLDHPLVTYLPGAVVWDAPEPAVLAYTAGADSGRIHAGTVIVAAGAYDRPVPFPGWTLPGVVTAGAVQNLIKGQRIVPGGRTVVAGNGPLLLVVATNLLHAGVDVAAVVEAAPIDRRLWRQAPRLIAAPAILCLAAKYRLALRAAGIPLSSGATAIEASGGDAVDAVTVAAIDSNGRVDRGRAQTIAADTLVTGFGLTPSVELTRLLDCRHRFDPLRGGWLPVRSRALETSVDGVFAVGDCAAIGGVEMALVEGRLAALGAALRLGRDETVAIVRRRRRLERHRARLDRFRTGIERVFAPPRDFLDLLTPDTVVCRCEDVTVGDLRLRVAEGAGSMTQLKATTRVGMGRCQGRNCSITLATMVAEAQGVAIGEVAWPRVRPPARPILIGDLLHEDIPPPVLPEDPHLPRGKKLVKTGP
jgi:NADPH-dependent 2,4-dienoyl-CoA reductase/sulfur reductase-like enzyme